MNSATQIQFSYNSNHNILKQLQKKGGGIKQLRNTNQQKLNLVNRDDKDE